MISKLKSMLRSLVQVCKTVDIQTQIEFNLYLGQGELLVK